ncbi:MAG TPA: rhomboid family intramembrane serine protease [Blastocatellia bacterium]|nr:rhomboid family intramembrane serine protease [Blastocatellia bacterium]
MFFPVGSDKDEVRRIPWITFSLIALNIFAFSITYLISLKDQQRADAAAEQVQEFLRVHPELMDGDRMDELARVGIVPKLEGEYLKLTLSQMGRDHADLSDYNLEFAEYERLLTAYIRLREAPVFKTLGYVPASHRRWDVFTSIFVHSSFWALLENMLFFFAVGFALEDLWGRSLFAVFFVACGVAGCFLHGLFYTNSHLPLVGASGAIAGVMGAYLVRLYHTKIKFFYVRYGILAMGSGNYYGYFSLPAYVYLPLWFALELILGLATRNSGAASSHWAHIGGFVFGMAFAGIVQAAGLEEKYLKPAIEAKIDFGSDKTITDALDLLEKGDATTAELLLNAYMSKKPNDPSGLMAQVRVYEKTENVVPLREIYCKLIHQQLLLREYDSAVVVYDALLGTFGDSEPVIQLEMRDWMAICDHLFKEEMYKEAAIEYRRAGRANTTNPYAAKALLMSGEIFFQKLRSNREAAVSLVEAKALNSTQQHWVKRMDAAIEKIKEQEMTRIQAGKKAEEKPVDLPKNAPEPELRIPPEGLSL